MSTMIYYNQNGKQIPNDKYACAKKENNNYYLRIHPMFDDIVNVKERFFADEIRDGEWLKVGKEAFGLYLQFLKTHNIVYYHKVRNITTNKKKENYKWRKKVGN